MKSEWNTIRAADFIDFNPRVILKKGTIATKVAMDKLKPFSKNIPETEKAEFNGGAKFCNGDTVMARITPCLENGKTAFVDILDDGEVGFGSTEFIVMRAKPGISDPQFVYYTAINPAFRNVAIQSMVGSSGRQRVQQSVLNELELQVPDLDEQKHIGAFLESIDKKIMLNNNINDNLLEQVLCIYASLIEGKPRNGHIGDYCILKSGFAFKSKWWQASGVPVVKIGSINQDYLNLTDCSYVSEDKISLAKDFVVSGGDLLIAMTGATIGKFTMVPKTTKTILVNQRVGKFFLGDNPVSRIPFIYSTLKQPEIISEVINRGQGSAQPNVSASDIMSIPCVIPQPAEISAFNGQTAPMFELIINNQCENTVLTNIRNSLLPYLMSGEIDVSAVQL
jgi:type I restriction enzyme S subunit